jgi:uncharacterized protein YciU (UPF0263 family)
MGWFDDVRNAVVSVVQKAIDIHRDAFTAVLDALAQVGHDLVTFSEYFRTGLEKLYANVVPQDVARWVTLNWFLLETAAEYGASFISNFSAALKTGRLAEIFDLVKPAAVTAMRNARLEVLHSAERLPSSIICLIPDANDRAYLAECKYTTYDRVDDKRFAEVWSHFCDKTSPNSAITLIDVVLFRKAPDLLEPADIFLFVHEVKHLLQFRDKGVDSFVSDYLDDKASGRQVPMLEEEADLFACGLVHGQQPHYIAKCP